MRTKSRGKSLSNTQKNILCKALLFDMDGVLVDSTGAIERSWQKWGKFHNLDLQKLMKLIHGRPAMDTIKSIAPYLDAKKEWETLIRQELKDIDGLSSYFGVTSLLKSLPLKQWAIVTSAPRAIAINRLDKLQLPKPEMIVCAEDVSNGKPSPEGYIAAAEALRIPNSECVVIEDSIPGIHAGLSAGMKVIAVATTNPIEKLTSATWCINSIQEIRIENQNKFMKISCAKTY